MGRRIVARFLFAFALPLVLIFCVASGAGFALSKPAFPVVFVHGIDSSSQTWLPLRELLIKGGWTFGGFPTFDPNTGKVASVLQGDFYAMNFSDFNEVFSSQNLSFARQGWELAAIVDEVLKANAGKTKVILVAHSMGGLASRAYLQGLAQFNNLTPRINYRGDVAQIVTIGTPHQGAEIAVLCIELPSACEVLGYNPMSVAVESLSPDSSAFDPALPFGLNNLRANPLPTDTRYVSIIGTGQSTILEEPGDGIVSITSQNLGSLAGIGSIVHVSKQIPIGDREDCGVNIILIFAETHTCEPGDPGVWAEILAQLRQLVPVDVYFIVDLSGSFIDDLPSFKAQAPQIISTLKASNPNTRFGLAKFEDYPIFPFGSAVSGDKAYQRLVDLTFNTGLILNTIAGLFTRSGGDGPQSQLPALFQAATGAGQDLSGLGFPGASIPPGQQANFRNGATKIFMLWTDASFHRPGDPGTIPYPGPSFTQTIAAVLALDPPKVIGISSGGGGFADLQTIAAATNSLAPPGGVDCNADGTIDLLEGEPLVCAISPSGGGIGEAVIALVQAATPIGVEVDIKPGSSPNSINPRNKGVIPVAILTTDVLDAMSIDPTTIRFGITGSEANPVQWAFENVDGDGDTDIILHFRTQDTDIQCGDTSASLTGTTFGGQTIQGSDSINTVGCK